MSTQTTADPAASEDKSGSLRALDALNFCNAGIQTGLGPFMAIFYTSVRHWNPGQIGVLIACQSLAGIIVQSAVGHWVDESHHKRILTAVAATMVTLGAVGIAVLPQYWAQIAVQLIIGLAVTVFPAATSAFAMGMVSKDQFASRVSRNESVTHSGNLLFAIAAGAIGTFLALQGIFYAAAAFAFGMAGAVLYIRTKDVSHEAARAAGEGEGDQKPKSFRELIQDGRIITFALAVVLFFCANAATLPLVGEMLSQGKKQSAWQISACVIVAEAVMIGVAALSGKFAEQHGRKGLFVAAFLVLALRNGLTVLNHNEIYLIGLQALDGIAAAIYGVLLTLVTADLAKGTGRFNFLQGGIQSAMGMGGFLSNMLFGFVAKAAGFNASFIGLSCVALAGAALYAFKNAGNEGGVSNFHPGEVSIPANRKRYHGASD